MTEPSVEDRPAETAPAPAGRGQKLWAVLLVLDSFFVITFGGTLAMKLYQHWQAPPPVVPSRAHRPPRAATPPAASTAPAAAAPAPAAPAAAAKPEPAKPAAKAEPAPANGLRPPKPSLLHEAPRHEGAGLQGAAGGAPAAEKPAAPAAPAANGAKNKALPTEFSLKAPGAKSVELVGAFIVHGGRKAMVSHPDGTWTLTLYLTPNTYRYWFVVNGKKTLDPSSPRVDRGASVVTVGQ